jgi:hypothetical protein
VFGSLEWPEALLLRHPRVDDAALGQVVTLPTLLAHPVRLNVESGLNDGPASRSLRRARDRDDRGGFSGWHHALTLLVEQIGYGVLRVAGGSSPPRCSLGPARPRRGAWLQVVGRRGGAASRPARRRPGFVAASAAPSSAGCGGAWGRGRLAR